MNNSKNLKPIDFGTAGIRGKVGKGIDHLSLAHVQRVAHGYAQYLANKFKTNKKIKVVVGRDNRNYSCKYARVIAEIMSKYPNFEIILPKKITPTPFVSFLVLRNNAQAALNVTASHNPKEYNGIKLYNEHGSQCLSEEIKTIKTYFEPYDSFSENYATMDPWPKADNIRNATKLEWDAYIENVVKVGQNTDKNTQKIKIAYSPLHGTGISLIEQVFNKIGWIKNEDVFFEPRQMIQDRFFSTCNYPNPERDEVYNLVIDLANKNQCELAIVTDPDADRVGVKVKHKGEFIALNGNETATLILDYLIKTNPPKQNQYLIHSFVSSNLPSLIAQKNNLSVKVVPTGFKWIGQSIVLNPNNFYYGFEESYGSLIDPNIARDKDAIQATVIIAKMAQYYKDQGLTLIDVLNNIYAQFGYVTSKTIDINIDADFDLANLQNKFKNIEIIGKKIEDFNNYTNFLKSNMIKITFESNSDWIALRPSGTEPKIKFYIFAYGKNQQESREKLAFYEQIINNLLKK
ncbi:phospho-sugar mutase [Mycoplasma simbae]|uniref:phospho-sugar mutase n=1 Tax=Mycoplasma simbae TaxID=36744 RepID=UPI000496223E|nr:phospho-sugar mutase [Mycoplasma simbae]